MTARPETWMLRTLDRIEDQTGWRPQDACFAPRGWRNAPAIKQHLLKKEVFPIHGAHARYIAIESNPRTRVMYAKFSIPCFWVEAEGTFLTEGTRVPSIPDDSGRPRIFSCHLLPRIRTRVHEIPERPEMG